MKAVTPLQSNEVAKVKLLHLALKRLKFLGAFEVTRELPADEEDDGVFGPVTQEWIEEASNKLLGAGKVPPAGTVNGDLATAINEALVKYGTLGKLMGRLVNGREGTPGARPLFKRPGMTVDASSLDSLSLGRAVTDANDAYILYVNLDTDQEAGESSRRAINLVLKPGASIGGDDKPIGMSVEGLTLYDLQPGLLRPDVVDIEADPTKVRADYEFNDVLGQAIRAIGVLTLEDKLPELSVAQVQQVFNVLQQLNPSTTPATVLQLEHLVIAHLLAREGVALFNSDRLTAAFFYGLLRTDRLLHFTWRLNPALTARTGIRLARYQALGAGGAVDRDNQRRRLRLLVEVAFYSEFISTPGEAAGEAVFGTGPELELGLAVRDFVRSRIAEGDLYGRDNGPTFELKEEIRITLAQTRLHVVNTDALANLRPKEPFHRKVDGTESLWSSRFEADARWSQPALEGLPRPLVQLLSEFERLKNLSAPSDAAFAGFDIRSGDVRAIAGMAGWNHSQVSLILAYQRVLRLTQYPDVVAFLLTKQANGKDLSSAWRVRQMGQQRFTNAYEVHLKGRVNAARDLRLEAKRLFARATRRAEVTSHVAGEMRSLLTAYEVAALRGTRSAQDLPISPTWSAFFGSTDSCACSECDSIHGPASYLVDVLQFFKRLDCTDAGEVPAADTTESPSSAEALQKTSSCCSGASSHGLLVNRSAETVFDVLMGRRPDIGYLDLNCANALTAVPQIDLINELLEDRVRRHTLELQLHVEPGPITLPVLNALKVAGTGWPQLSEKAVVTRDSRDNRLVRDQGLLLLLERRSSAGDGGCPTWLAHELRQTYGNAEELAAMPEHRNTRALEVLKTSVANLRLPYDADRDLATGYLKKLGSSRWGLIQALTPIAGVQVKPVPVTRALALELLNLTAAEFDRITVEKVHGQHEFWALPKDRLLPELSRCDVLLSKTELKTEPLEDPELDQLLRCEFLRGAGDPLRMVSADPSNPTAECDASQRRVLGLTIEAIDRLHRFLRLQRRLTWPLTLVDRLVRSPRLGNARLDDVCLGALAEARLLAEDMGMKPETVASWFAALDTYGKNSPYARVFLQPMHGLPYEAFLPERMLHGLSNGRCATLREHDNAIASALGVQLRELGLLLDHWRGDAGHELQLSVDTLSKCWAWFQFANRLAWPTADLLQLLPMLGLKDAIDHPSHAREVWHAVVRLKKWSVNIRDLQYWIRGAVDPLLGATAPELSDVVLSATLNQLMQSFRSLDSESADLQIAPDGKDDKAECLRKLTETLGKVPGLQPAQIDRLLGVAQDHSVGASVVAAVQESPLAAVPGLLGAVTADKLPKWATWTEDDTLSDVRPATALLRTSTSVAPPSVGAAGGSESHRAHRRWVSGIIELIINDALTRERQAATRRVLTTQFKVPSDLLNPILEQLHGTDARLTLLQTIVDGPWYRKPANAAMDELLATAFEEDGKRATLSTSQVTAFREAVLRREPLSEWDPAEHLATVQGLAAMWSRVVDAIRKAHKASLFAIGIRMDASTHLAWGLTPAQGYGKEELRPFDALGWFSPDHLTLEQIEDEKLPKRFADWLHLMMGLELIRVYPLKESSSNPSESWGAVSVLERSAQVTGTDPSSTGTALRSVDSGVFDALGQISGRPADELRSLALQLDLDANAFIRPQATVRVIEAHEALTRIGFPIIHSEVAELVAVDITERLTDALSDCLKQKTPAESWLTTLKDVHDPLRERRRDALVAYLTADPKTHCFHDVSDLWDYFLVDPLTAACAPTSRIRHAHDVVQLFAGRCLSAKEPSVDPRADDNDGDDWREWHWMRNYRVWEANRKIFLYPENWLEPALRDDKSEFFREFEQTLQQGDLNENSLKEATEAYLARLDDSAFLEVVAIHYQDQRKYFEKGHEEGYVLHVVAKTKGGDPAVYYYRRFKAEQEWTPWERIDLDIVTDHPLLVERNGRLLLMWPVFTDMVDDVVEAGQYPTKENPPPPAPKGWSIQLSHSERLDGRWSPKRVSKERIATIKVRATAERMSIERRRCKFVVRNQEPMGDYAPGVNDIKDGKGFFVLAFGYLKADSSANLLPSDVVREPELLGVFNLAGNKGYPVVVDINNPTMAQLKKGFTQSGLSVVPQIADTEFETQRWVEQDKDLGNDLSLRGLVANNLTRTTVLKQTPGTFKITSVQQTTVVDRAVLKTLELLQERPESWTPGGLLTPWFYEDGRRGYVVVPTFRSSLSGGSWQEQTISGLLPAINRLWTSIAGATGRWDVVLSELLRNKSIDLSTLKDALNGRLGLRFLPFHHPKTGDLKRALAEGGLELLMGFTAVSWDRDSEFSDTLLPENLVLHPHPQEASALAFDASDGYASYNWELFYHLPTLVAEKLLRGEQQEAAFNWLHFIFNPAGIPSRSQLYGPTAKSNRPSALGHFWQFQPFRSRSTRNEQVEGNAPPTPDSYVGQRIETILAALSSPGDSVEAMTVYRRWTSQVTQWRANPFIPFQVARGRTVAFQKATFMRYLDTLIAHGDALFRRGAVESIEQARQIYKTAQDLLGPKPRQMKPLAQRPARTYRELEVHILGEGPYDGGGIDDFGNSLVELENHLPEDLSLDESPQGSCAITQPTGALLSKPYFCTPRNPRLVAYWDTVEDRLYKIRHCLDIDGAQRSMALFDPPIDPGLLARAAANGISLGDALSLATGPAPIYRFQVLMQKATELAQMVVGFGASLMQIIEKHDAEGLAQLRAGQELGLLKLVRETRVEELKEAKQAKLALERAKGMAEERESFYRNVEYISRSEALSLLMSGDALNSERTGLALSVAGSLSNMYGTLTAGVAGFGGTAQVSYSHGGANVGASVAAMGTYFTGLASISRGYASNIGVLANYERRWADWKLQERLATKEIAQIEAQIGAADIRVLAAESQLRAHDRQVEQSAEVLEYIKDRKFSRQDLYDWMKGEIGALYFQAWKLASRFALRVERAFHHEIGPGSADTPPKSYIRTDTWDGLHKGTLAGEKLLFDLKELDEAYLTLNRREFNLVKHVSLLRLSPSTFLDLMRRGECEFDVPEWLFDMSYPGHYFRRISSVSISIPGVIGPYAGINSTLTLLKHSVRVAPASGDEDNPNLKHDFSRTQSIATSTAQDDSGVFEINYADERNRPFERAGAISRWRLELHRSDNRELDFESITDVVLHIRYTARDGGTAYKQERRALVNVWLEQGMPGSTGGGASAPLIHRLFLLDDDFPAEWHRFATMKDVNGRRSLRLPDLRGRMPFVWPGLADQAAQVTLVRLDGDQESRRFKIVGSGLPEGSSWEDVSLTNLEFSVEALDTEPRLGLVVSSFTKPSD